MSVETEVQEVASALDHFLLPAALVNLPKGRFLTWNETFLHTVKLDSSELRSLPVSDLMSFVWKPSSERRPSRQPAVSYGSCIVKAIHDGILRTGRAFRREPEFVLTILDHDEHTAATEDFYRGLSLGKQQENERIRQQLHDFMSQQLMVASFRSHRLARKIADKGGDSGDADEILELAVLLDELIEEVHQALAGNSGYAA